MPPVTIGPVSTPSTQDSTSTSVDSADLSASSTSSISSTTSTPPDRPLEELSLAELVAKENFETPNDGTTGGSKNEPSDGAFTPPPRPTGPINVDPPQTRQDAPVSNESTSAPIDNSASVTEETQSGGEPATPETEVEYNQRMGDWIMGDIGSTRGLIEELRMTPGVDPGTVEQANRLIMQGFRSLRSIAETRFGWVEPQQ